MKMRCPHCRAVIEQLVNKCCPACGKGARIAWERLPEGHPKARKPRRPPRPRRDAAVRPSGILGAALMIPLGLLGYRSRIFWWSLVLVTILAGRFLLMDVDKGGRVRGSVPPKVSRSKREMTIIRTALEWFRADCRRYPTEAEGLKALVRDPGIAGWNGFYITGLPPDLWERPYQYALSNGTVRLFCLGPDGKPGTADDIPSPNPNYRELFERIDVKDLPHWDTNAPPPIAGG